MRRFVFLLSLLLGLSAQADSSRRSAEVAEVVAAVAEESMGLSQAEARLAFLSQDPWACTVILDTLRKRLSVKGRQRLVELLATVAVSSPDVEGVLIRALSDEELGQRLAGIRGLGHAKATHQAERLERLLGDRLLGVRREAAKALAVLAQGRSAPALLAQAKVEADPETRALMLTALGRTAGKAQRAELEKFLDSDSEVTRLAAAQALCRLGAPKGLAHARKLLGSAERSERVQGVRLFEGASLKDAQAVLGPALKDPEHRVRAVANRVLYQAGDQTRLDVMVLESARAMGEERLPWEDELERVHLSDEARRAILTRAGLK